MKNLILTSFLFLIAGGCYYVDTDKYEVEIQSEYDPLITLSSNLDEIDTVRVADSLYFRYDVSIDTGRLYFTELYIGYKKIYQSVKKRDSIIIYPEYYIYPGEYDLTLIAYFKSYSGNLADIYNSDYLIADTSWLIHYDLNFLNE